MAGEHCADKLQCEHSAWIKHAQHVWRPQPALVACGAAFCTHCLKVAVVQLSHSGSSPTHCAAGLYFIHGFVQVYPLATLCTSTLVTLTIKYSACVKYNSISSTVNL